MAKRGSKFAHENLKHAAIICFRSANELFEDAQLLFCYNRFARAVFLASIGLEELGKVRLALELYKKEIEPDKKEFMNFWVDHKSKIAQAHGYLFFNPEILQKIVPNEVPQSYKDWFEYCEHRTEFYYEYSKISSDIKLSSLYVDIKSNKKRKTVKFTLPSLYFKKEHARKFISELEEKIDELQPKIRDLGRFKIPPYDTGTIYDYYAE